MAKSSTTTNPFHYLYAGISGREDSHYNLRVYFPHSITYKHTPREIRVRRDVSVEEVIGHALWSFWEDKALPALDDPETIPEGVDRKVRLSSAGWCLRIVEEDTDGEVDEDYPGAYFSLTFNDCIETHTSDISSSDDFHSVIGRSGPISGWLQHELAVCEASDTQSEFMIYSMPTPPHIYRLTHQYFPYLPVKQNLDLDSAIVRRASRLMKSSQAPDTTEDGLAAAQHVRRRQEGTGYSDDEILPPPVVHQTGTGEKRLLTVKWEDYADSAHLWTTLGVYVNVLYP